MRSLTILGSTGSIGTQALDVVRRNPDRFKVVGLSAGGTNQDLLVGQIREFLPPLVAIADEDVAADVKEKLGQIRGVELVIGPEATETIARESETDMVLNGLVGSAGLALISGPSCVAQFEADVLAASRVEVVVLRLLVIRTLRPSGNRLSLPVGGRTSTPAGPNVQKPKNSF